MTTPTKPWGKRVARTTFLRVPLADWSAVKRGIKTEFRLEGRAASPLWAKAECPTPVVGYAQRKGVKRHDAVLLVLEATWMETIAAITPESLVREGFADFAAFRRYWMGRHSRRFEPMLKVRVFQVRPFKTDDRPEMGNVLLQRLYGEHL